MRVGFIGLGAIGEPMAARLAAVHEVAVWNRTGAKAQAFAELHDRARAATSPRDVAAGADAVVTCLPTSAEVEALLDGPDGLLAGMAEGTLLVDCTSGDPATSRRIAERLRERQIGFVDAPVSGGPPLAKTGQLTVMCGGSDVDVAQASAVVAPFAARVVRLGPVGAGHALKAGNNALLAVNIIAVG